MITRRLLSWTFYWMGDMISRPMIRFDLPILHDPYQWLMRTSERLQGTGTGPWGPLL